MLDKFAEMTKDVLNARKSIANALTKLQGKDNIITNIEKIQDLGITMTKAVPALPDESEINEEAN